MKNFNTSMDAQVWVNEWFETIKEHPTIPFDEGTMIGWFANALMSGWDNHRWKHPKVYIQFSNIRSVCGTWMYEPSNEERVQEYNKYMGNDSLPYEEDESRMLQNTWIEEHEVKY